MTANSYPFLHVEEALRNAVNDGITAGATLVFGQQDRRHEISVGRAQVMPYEHPLSSAILFDLASLTKLLSTTWLAMKMTTSGHLDLDARRSVIERFLQTPLAAAPGERTLYSDIGPILVGDLLEQLDPGRHGRLDSICAAELYQELGLEYTFFVHLDDPLPAARRPSEAFAATENCAWRERVLSGEVHDENAHLLRGVAGHPGLFATAGDLERIARAFLGDMDIGVDRDVLKSLTSPQQMAPDSNRAFGWDKARGMARPVTVSQPLRTGIPGLPGRRCGSTRSETVM
jgi:CubicO group peptidase (beta-lactamase class C family)